MFDALAWTKAVMPGQTNVSTPADIPTKPSRTRAHEVISPSTRIERCELVVFLFDTLIERH
jgi:hypothetical protein